MMLTTEPRNGDEIDGRIAFVVGHRNWGKSRTLWVLTGGQHRSTTIDGVRFAVRRMSNDDEPARFTAYMAGLRPVANPRVIATLCPDFARPTAGTEETLNQLIHSHYRLFFWVIERRFGGTDMVARDEMQRLEHFGPVREYQGGGDDQARAAEFRQFIRDVVLP